MKNEPRFQGTEIDEDLAAEVQFAVSTEEGQPVSLRVAIDKGLRSYLAQRGTYPQPGQSPQAASTNPALAAHADQSEIRGYDFVADGRSLFLPQGTSGRMLYKGKHYYFDIKGTRLIHGRMVMTASNFAKKIGGPGRSAKSSIQIKRPQDADYIPAKELFETDAKPVPRKDVEEDAGPDILYRDVLVKMDRLEGLGFPEKLFREIHHRKGTWSGFKKYAKAGIDAGYENPKTTYNSSNGRVARRIEYLIAHHSGQKTDAEWLDLISGACDEIPFKEAD